MQINTFNDAMKRRFGCKVYKIALDGGMTCPNRDGTVGSRGCIFCGERGSGDFAAPKCGDVFSQIEEAKRRVSRKCTGPYIAYFQSYTNTYAPAEYLRTLFERAIRHPEVAALAVATRPDCLPDEVVELLAGLAQEKPVWVELGLQTVHSETAAYIRRGFDLRCFDDAVQRLNEAGIETVAHMIIGLPGETPEMMYETVDHIGETGCAGIKLQLLHVLSDTDLARDYALGKFEVLTEEEYIEILAECVRRVRPDMVIHRLTGDGAKARLVAPLWSGDKKRVLNDIRAYFRREDVVQGEHYKKA